MAKRISLFNGLPPYPGGKRRLVPWIFANLAHHLPAEKWSSMTFLDAFLGGGAVSLYAKAQGFRQILANDWSNRSQAVGEALLLNQVQKFNQADWTRIAGCEPSDEIRKSFTPHVFSSRHAEMLDRINQVVQLTQDPTRKALYRLLLWHLAGEFVCFGSSIGISNRPYAEALDGLRSWDTIPAKRYLDRSVNSLLQPTWKTLEKRAKAINQSVFGGSPVQLYQQDAIEFACQAQGDIIYFDPPYAQTARYEAAFKTIDKLLTGSVQADPPSSFSKSSDILDALYESSRHIPIWILSYGDKTVSLDDLKTQMQAHRPDAHITIHARQYTHMPHVSENRSHQELLIIASPKQGDR
jgi:16S rRNA G966 N2-methylase RsmD